MRVHEMTAAQLADGLAKGQFSSRELVETYFQRINQVEERVLAFVSLCREEALQAADQADKLRSQGKAGALTGVPIAVKDNMSVKGQPLSCSSKILQGYRPPFDATVVSRLKEMGMPIVGSTNMDEFAMGSSTETSYNHITRNPWDLERVPGGSSGGSAASVAAGEVPLALGSDTGGSIRQPAALCGLVGVKPTYGRVSRYGIVAFASSLDQVGTFSRDVTDAALLTQVIAGHDPLDSTSIPDPVGAYQLHGGVKGLRIGIPKEYFQAGIEPQTRQAVERAIALYQELGAICEEVSLPHTEYALATYYLVATAEASSNLARFDGVRFGHRSENSPTTTTMYMETRAEGFGTEVKRRIMLGTYALSAGYYDAYYLKALKVRRLIKQDFDKAFAKYDLLLAPTTPTPAFKVGEKCDDIMAMYVSDICTTTANLAGIPALSLPCGFTDSGLPIGMQLMAPDLAEERLFRAAYSFEQATEYHKARPSL